ncbi:MAG: type II toxin-antitoxin system HicB family antitoxin [Candidatus Cloacimonetes bacterium]|nr:type II toxin-antitoxin system HicB family antitoxin [Candidatus Cloacimonadota bacterium]
MEEYLRICKERGISPHKEYSGKFNLRIPPELHSKIAVLAASEDKSLNQWVAEKLEKSLAM